MVLTGSSGYGLNPLLTLFGNQMPNKEERHLRPHAGNLAWSRKKPHHGFSLGSAWKPRAWLPMCQRPRPCDLITLDGVAGNQMQNEEEHHSPPPTDRSAMVCRRKLHHGFSHGSAWKSRAWLPMCQHPRTGPCV